MKSLLFFIIATPYLCGQVYRGAELRTTEPVLYGKFEARYKPAQGDGLVSSFFTYNDNYPNTPWAEIDIELLGVYDHVIDMNTITWGQNSHIRQHYIDFNPHLDFHTYGFEWTPDYVAWFVDGQEVYRQTGEHVDSLHYSQKIMMNIWNPIYSDWVGAWDPVILPRFSYYDYVSYAEYTPGGGDIGTGANFTLLWRDDFDSYNSERWEKSHNHTWGGNQSLFIEDNIHFENGYMILCLTSISETGYVDNTPPSALWARQENNIIRIRFSEELNSLSTGNIENYSLAGANFTSVFLLNDLRTVELTMDTYDLSMNVLGVFNIEDDNPTPNSLDLQAVWINIPEPLGDTIRINTGGNTVGAYLPDQIWGPDKEYGYVAGNYQLVNNSIDIGNTNNDIVYRSSLNRVASYKARLVPGHYTIKMLFSDNHYSEPGERVFDITIEDSLVVNDLDILSIVQPMNAHEVVIDNFEVSDGILDIYLSAEVYGTGYAAAGPYLNGLEVYFTDYLSVLSNVPKKFDLNFPFPNPFNSTISLPIDLTNKAPVKIEIYNLLGYKVETVVDVDLEKGKHILKWNGSRASTGLYFVRSTINEISNYKKIMLIK